MSKNDVYVNYGEITCELVWNKTVQRVTRLPFVPEIDSMIVLEDSSAGSVLRLRVKDVIVTTTSFSVADFEASDLETRTPHASSLRIILENAAL